MSVFSAFAFWSPTLGCDAVRLSMVDARGGEFWQIIPREIGSRYREARDLALDEIEDAIAAGCQPGEVREDRDEDEAA